ncbi:MAG TPA: redoxin family protein [Allosphingosinicella sp.]|jgi:cytochrome c biogenesis protein CcmG/thiol:disulfide interchange protein DsbE
MKRLILWVPFALFALIGVVVATGLLRPSDRTIPSRLVGKPLPPFSLPQAMPERRAITRADFGTGQPRILNIFASWCVPCIAEAPQLMALSRQGIPIDAVAIRDRPQDVARFLGQWGDPYRNIGLDADAGLQLAIGSSGVPETFIIDGRGTIRYQHIGAINETDMPRIIEEYEKAKG